MTDINNNIDENIKGLIFDFDGTIINLDVDWKKIKKKLNKKYNLENNLSLNDTFLSINEKYDNRRVMEAIDILSNFELANTESSMSNASIIKLIKKNKLKKAIFSNNTQRTINFFLEREGILDCFDIIVAKDNVKKYKPDTEGIDKILNFWNYKNDQVFYIGNDENDKSCGNRANINTLII